MTAGEENNREYWEPMAEICLNAPALRTWEYS